MTGPRHRADIDGLRAVAIALVVGYHAGAPGFAGGFVGVDVFFVVSGFLITRQLWSGQERAGTIDVLEFWGRRIRRLAPAATVMILVVVAVSVPVASPLAWDDTWRAAVASSVYLSNGFFGAESADYFAAEVTTNPLLHTWSLAVEEQFYLVWPVVLLVAASCGGSTSAGRRRRWLAVVTLVSVASFALCVVLTQRATPWAFYASPARAWEFGLGAMVALGGPRWLRPCHGRRTLLAALGTALVLSAVWMFDRSTAFPGAWALLPATGTALLIAADARVLRPLLSAAPVQWLGRMSYGWYLWHWPILVLGVGYLGPVGLGPRVGLTVVALAPAVWSHRVVEQPLRFHPRLARSAAPNFVLGAALAGAVALAVVAAGTEMQGRLDQPEVRVLAAAQQDVPVLADQDCETLDVDELFDECRTVPPDGDGSAPILLLGDSHAGQWQPALEQGAVRLGHPLVTSWRGNCPAIPVAVTVDGRSSAECRSRQAHMLDLVDDLEPAAVVLSHSAAYDVSDAEWQSGLETMVAELEERHIPVGVLLDIPRQETDPVHCAAVHGLDAECTVDRETADAQLASAHARELEILVDAGHGVAFDPVPVLCDREDCPLLVDDVVTYRDSNHLTATFASRLGPDIRRWLRHEVLGG